MMLMGMPMGKHNRAWACPFQSDNFPNGHALGRSWVAVEQTLKFLPLARVRNDIVYEPEASRQCHSLQEQEEEISMSARLPPRNDIVSIYVKPPLNK